jgi:hypothetical protein
VTAPAPGQAIEAALQDVAKLLQAGNVPAAVVAVERLGVACQAAATTGLDDVTRSRLQPLVERCTVLAGKVNAGLAATLLQLGTGSRAHRAYNPE